MTGKQIRKAGNRGTFYPYMCREVEKYFTFFKTQAERRGVSELKGVQPKAIIAPHAGYVYSGYTAYLAHKALSLSKPETIVVIGPSHHVLLDGVSAAFTEAYETPCADLKTDWKLLDTLNERFGFDFSERAHYKEHSTETQMPFIAKYNPQAKVVELIYGRVGHDWIAAIIEEILKDDKTAVVISSDLSHFYPLREAERLDAICLNAIEKQDVSLFEHGCEACGVIGMKALAEVAHRQSLTPKILDYRTSADASGNTGRVVGYASVVYY